VTTEQPLTPPPAPPLEVEAVGDDRPEIAIGAAFVGGFLTAMILKRLGR
jgi:hypothetical protein